MNRKQLYEFIENTYGITPDYPWLSTPDNAVFRHPDNNKWFAIAMTVDKSKLGLKQKGSIDIVNVKCDYILICSLLKDPGFFPAYHMNKTNWITVSLDSAVADDTLKWLVDMSFDVTKPKLSKKEQYDKP